MKKPRYLVPFDTSEKVFQPKRGKNSYSRKQKHKKDWKDLEIEIDREGDLD